VAGLKDVDGREFLVLGVLAAAVLLIGIWPAPLLNVMEPSIRHLVDQAVATKLPV
jgi:NADH-quinone oxidoreductase subunit M